MLRQRLWAVCLGVVISAGLAGLACQSAKEQPAVQAPAPKPVVVVLTSGMSDMPRFMMALGLAGSALDERRETFVYPDVNAPELAKKEESMEPFVAGKRMDAAADMGGDSAPREMLKMLMARGAKVAVCPMCTKMLKIEPQSLMDGVASLTNEEFLAKSSAATVFSY